MVPFAVGANEGRSDEVSLRCDNEVALRCGVDLPLSNQHVECVTQDLQTWCGYTCGEKAREKP